MLHRLKIYQHTTFNRSKFSGCKFCIQFRNSNASSIGNVEATGLKIMASRSPSIFLLEVKKARDGDGLRQCPNRTSVTEDIPPPTCYADTSPPHAHKEW
jgi:hypothetical protein